jgi:hypothetical protein
MVREGGEERIPGHKARLRYFEQTLALYDACSQPAKPSSRPPSYLGFSAASASSTLACMTLTDVLLIAATACSPLIAVQATRWLDDRKEERSRKLNVFKVLMATRALVIAPQHVEALNRIELEFSPKRPTEKAVLDAWQQYLDHLGNTQMDPDAWALRRSDLLVEMLYAMGKALGYDFNKTQVKNGIYLPTAHGRLEQEQERIRSMTLELLEGKRPLPMFVTNLPSQDRGTAASGPST